MTRLLSYHPLKFLPSTLVPNQQIIRSINTTSNLHYKFHVRKFQRFCYRAINSNKNNPNINPNNALYSNQSNNGSNKSKHTKSNEAIDTEIVKILWSHLWPQSNKKGSFGIKLRVITSLTLLFSGKLVGIEIPFIFKNLIDTLAINHNSLTTTTANIISTSSSLFSENIIHFVNNSSPEVGLLLFSSPIALALGYGIARSTSAGMNELKNAIFSTVAHGAIREVSKDIFIHLHKLDMQFHLERNTGVLSRTIDRGSRSINFVLNSMLFNVIPTSLEVFLVSGILAYKLGQ